MDKHTKQMKLYMLSNNQNSRLYILVIMFVIGYSMKNIDR